jgi:uncharacterized protein
MSESHYRSFTPELEVRSGGDGRTVYGIAVPYNAPTRIDEQLVEQFARGAFNHQIDKPQRVKFAREHAMLGGSLIGAATMLRDDSAGLYVELRTARTPTGDETLELIREGAPDQLSIMFREGRNRRLGGGVVERVQADLREVAIVFEGAYGDKAVATGVRSVQRGTGPVLTDSEVDLRQRAERFLAGTQKLPDIDTELRAIRLGLPR